MIQLRSEECQMCREVVVGSSTIEHRSPGTQLGGQDSIRKERIHKYCLEWNTILTLSSLFIYFGIYIHGMDVQWMSRWIIASGYSCDGHCGYPGNGCPCEIHCGRPVDVHV